ncbi:proline-rich extensin-like protein EPR1 [Gracilaria domingensis]|nr:proline-rich extensin-like protein EPR1 [Gracilaria domingensis]
MSEYTRILSESCGKTGWGMNMDLEGGGVGGGASVSGGGGGMYGIQFGEGGLDVGGEYRRDWRIEATRFVVGDAVGVEREAVAGGESCGVGGGSRLFACETVRIMGGVDDRDKTNGFCGLRAVRECGRGEGKLVYGCCGAENNDQSNAA